MIRALCDTGSQLNIISKACADRIGLSKRKTSLEVCGVDGVNGLRTIRMSEAAMCSRFSDDPIDNIELIIVNKLSSTLPNGTLPWYVRSDTLADPWYYQPSPIDAILGAGVWAAIINSTITRLDGGLAIQDSRLGALVFGNEPKKQNIRAVCHATIAKNKDAILFAIARLWELEVDSMKKTMSADDVWCEENFLATHYRTRSGRYVITMPMKQGIGLGDSRASALRQFFFLESKLRRNPELAEKYIKFMREYENLGHMRKVNSGIDGGSQYYYIPHHAIT